MHCRPEEIEPDELDEELLDEELELDELVPSAVHPVKTKLAAIKVPLIIYFMLILRIRLILFNSKAHQRPNT